MNILKELYYGNIAEIQRNQKQYLKSELKRNLLSMIN